MTTSPPTNSRQIVQKLWSFCAVLRDDGLSYPDYVEQLTYLLFLKMAHERVERQEQVAHVIPSGLDWPSLTERSGSDLMTHYSDLLSRLGQESGMLGVIFRGARNKVRDPAKLKLLVTDLIDQNVWSSLDIDVKGDAYEGLLEKNAQDTKSGAGQYFTPRPVIRAIVRCVAPRLGEAVFDPACGTGGFLLAAHEYVRDRNGHLSKRDAARLRLETVWGSELVPEVTRLGTMNLFLHGIGPAQDAEGEPPIVTKDSLAIPEPRAYDVVLTNPPFGKGSGMTTRVRENETSNSGQGRIRTDFWASSSNKELNFLQHVTTVLKPGGRAAIVLPDGVLSAGGAAATVRRRLLEEFDVHTLLRLPTGIFYATGVNASVLFFDRPRRGVGRKGDLWVYDLRSDLHYTLVQNRLKEHELDDFVNRFEVEDQKVRRETWTASNPAGRWRRFAFSDLVVNPMTRLDLSWERTALAESRDQDELAAVRADIVKDVEAALAAFASTGIETD